MLEFYTRDNLIEFFAVSSPLFLEEPKILICRVIQSWL